MKNLKNLGGPFQDAQNVINAESYVTIQNECYV